MIIWVARVSRVSADRTDSSRGERAKHVLATDFFGRTSEECCGEDAATNTRGACAPIQPIRPAAAGLVLIRG